jgi:hypothetical protein
VLHALPPRPCISVTTTPTCNLAAAPPILFADLQAKRLCGVRCMDHKAARLLLIALMQFNHAHCSDTSAQRAVPIDHRPPNTPLLAPIGPHLVSLHTTAATNCIHANCGPQLSLLSCQASIIPRVLECFSASLLGVSGSLFYPPLDKYLHVCCHL